MKTLLANGCSYTYGAGLDETLREEKVWPNQVKELLGYDRIINLAAGCGSNQRIVRTTIEWILSQPASILENTLAIIQFTNLHRYEYYVPKQNKVWENHSERWIRNKVDAVVAPYYNDIDINQLVDYNNIRLSTYTDIEGYWTWLVQCEALASIFKRYNIKYYYWNLSGMLINPDEIYYRFLRDNYNWINNDLHFTCEFDSIPNDGHPTVNGHRQIAEFSVKYIKTQNLY